MNVFKSVKIFFISKFTREDFVLLLKHGFLATTTIKYPRLIDGYNGRTASLITRFARFLCTAPPSFALAEMPIFVAADLL